MKKLITFIALSVVFFFTSCSKEETHPLTGKWILENSSPSADSTNQESKYILFDQKSTTFNFKTNAIFNGKTYNGTWVSPKGTNQVTLTYLKDHTQSADSLSVTTLNSGETTVDFFENEELVTTLTDNGFEKSTNELQLDFQINDNQLSLTNAFEEWSFTREMERASTVSFSSIFRGLGGLVVLLGIAWLFSSNRKKINWSLVGKGMVLQLIIALLVLKVPLVEIVFDNISKGFVTIIGFTDHGIDFLFGQFGTGAVQGPLLTFAVKVLPTIIFFSALVSLLYYWGVLQKIVYIFAWIMKKFMRLSGAESLAAAGNVFLGQTESPLLVKPYLSKMTKSEIMCLMTGGMATIAGGVLAAYVGFLGGDDPVQQAFFAKHLLTASIISAPAAIIAAKILVPETEKINEDLSISKEKIGTNALEAISNGTTDGLKLAVNVGAMLLVFISLMAFGNWVLGMLGGGFGINKWIAENTVYDQLSFEFVLGYIGRPLVWIMGVNWTDSIYVGELLGTKTVLNEFVGYQRLGEMNEAGVFTSEKSLIMSTYMLCGFANFASIGIQIGGIGSLIPNRKGLLSQLGIKSLIGGTIACLMTAVIVGMLY